MLSETDPHARQVQLDLIRCMTPDQRLARMLELNAVSQAFAEAGVRAAHPLRATAKCFSASPPAASLAIS